MGVQSVRTIMCDWGGHPIIRGSAAHKFVDARTYGKTFCVECVEKMTAREILRALELDDIELADIEQVLKNENDPASDKLIYSSWGMG